MDLSNACIEPFVGYTFAHEMLNNAVKISALSLKIAEPIVSKDSEDPTKGILKQPVPPWGFVWTQDVKSLYYDVNLSLARLAIVQVFSAFDHYLVFLRAEMDRWRNFNAEQSLESSSNDEKGDISLKKLLELYSWNDHSFEPYEELFYLFQECRNCIVHRDSVVNKGLVEIVHGPEMDAINNNWPFSKENNELPDWPAFIYGERLAIQPKHAILASAVCYKLAKTLNDLFIQTTQFTGMAFMAAYHALISEDHPFRLNNHRSYEGAIIYFLFDRYRIRNVTPKDLNSALKALELHKIVQERYDSIYKK